MRAGRGSSIICWWGVSLLSLAGLGLATYLAVVYLSGHTPACGPSTGCEEVTTSSYAVFFGVPVTVLGVAMYSVLLLGSLALVALPQPPAALRHGLPLVSGLGVGFSAYLISVAVLVLHATCAYCLASAALVTLIFPLSLSAVLPARTTQTAGHRPNAERHQRLVGQSPLSPGGRKENGPGNPE